MSTPTTQKPATELGEGDAIYVSGPMRGFPDLNANAFNGLTWAMREAGYVVHNPHETLSSQAHFSGKPVTYQVAIREDIELLLDSDGICLLPGWRHSEGSRFEIGIAHALGLKFYAAEPYGDETFDRPGEWSWSEIEAPSTVAEGIDAEARRLVYGDRAATYGHPRGDFDAIGKIWGAILEMEVSAEDVALCMSGLKLARLAKSPTHRDSQVDAIGYMLCLARLQEDPTEAEAWQEQARTARFDAERAANDPETEREALREYAEAATLRNYTEAVKSWLAADPRAAEAVTADRDT